MGDRDFTESLAIELDADGLQLVDELRITDASLATGRVETSDPQPTEDPLAGATVTEGVRPRPDHRLLDRPQQLAATTPVAPSLAE